ncbi:MAG: hypothetical protein ABIQ95_06755 [Bdellovibrionia bacterium]
MGLKSRKVGPFVFGMKVIFVCLAVLSLDRISWADVQPGEVVAEENFSLYEKVSRSAVLNYTGLYKGSPLNDLGNSRQPTSAGDIDLSSPQSVESLLTIGYKVKPDVVVGVVGHFLYFPVGNPVGTGQNMQMLDPMLLVQKNNLINSGGFRLHGKVLVYLPLTANDTLRRNKLATAISPTLTASYDVPNTPLTLAAYGFVRGYVPTGEEGDGALTYKLYFAPNLSYQLSKTVAATLWVDLISASRFRGTPFLTGMGTDTVDVQPGISWDITKSININPVLNIYPSNPTLASTSIQAYVSARAF